MLLLCAWWGKRWHLSVFTAHFRHETKTVVLQNAQNLNSLADVTGSNPALARHYLRDLSLVDTTLTPPGFVTSQMVVTCGYHGFKSRRICLWWTRIHLQPALWIANKLSTFCWVFNAVVIIWFVTFYTQPLTQQQQQKTFLLKYWAWLIFDSEERWVYSNVDWIRFCPRRQIVWLTWALNQKFRRSWNIFRWAT